MTKHFKNTKKKSQVYLLNFLIKKELKMLNILNMQLTKKKKKMQKVLVKKKVVNVKVFV